MRERGSERAAHASLGLRNFLAMSSEQTELVSQRLCANHAPDGEDESSKGPANLSQHCKGALPHCSVGLEGVGPVLMRDALQQILKLNARLFGFFN